VDKLREIFNDYIPDVWIHVDHYKKGQSGDQPGYAVSLTAETTTGVIITKDFNFGNEKEFTLPEDLGQRAAHSMLDEIFTGGCVDSTNQWAAFLLMSVSAADNISALKLGRITQQSVGMLRNIKQFFNVQFKIEECQDEVYDSDSEMDEEGEQEKQEEEFGAGDLGEDKPQFAKSFIYSCIGIGLTNFARKLE